MYEDLRRYITHNQDILAQGTVAYYVKKIAEACKDQGFIQGFLSDVRTSQNIEDFYELNIFEGLLMDYHFTDVCNTDKDSVIVQTILKCFTNDYILEVWEDLFGSFIELTERGRNLVGLEPNYISDFIKNEWKDMNTLFDEVEDKELLKITNNEVYADDLIEELGYNGAFAYVCINTNDKNFDSLENVLKILGFCEISDGLFFYGSIGCWGYDYPDIELTKDDLERIIDLISECPKTNLNEYDDVFKKFNNEEVGMFAYLLNDLLSKRISEREVLF